MVKSEKARFFRKILCCPKMSRKSCFFAFLKNFVIKGNFVTKGNLKWKIIIAISTQSPCLAKFWCSSYRQKCSCPIRLHDSLSIIFQEIEGSRWFLFVCTVARHSQSTQSNLCNILEFCKKEAKNWYFARKKKHQSFLQVFYDHGTRVPEVPEIKRLQYVYNISRT